MKQKLKKILKLFTICTIIALSSCEKDLYNDAIHEKNHTKFKITEKTFDELMLDKKFKNAYNKIVETNNRNASKTIMEVNYNFTIAELPAKVIEVDNKISYTFLITRDSIDSNFFENLIVGLDSLNQTKAFIAKYEIDNSRQVLINKTPYKSVTYFPIIYNNNQTSKVTDCVSFSLSACNGDYYDCGGSECGFDIFTACEESGGPRDTSGDSDGGQLNNEEIGGIVTTPVNGNGSSNSPNLPCAKIKSKTGSNSYMNKFNAINTQQNFNLPYETGFVEKKINGVTQYVSQAASGGAALTFPSNAISYTHVHNNQPKTDFNGEFYDGGVKMLSPVDLLQLITKCSTAATAAGLTSLDVQGVMISNEGVFALTIIDTNISLTQINAAWKEFVSEYNRKSGDIIHDLSLSSSDRSEKLQEMMLDQLDILGLKDKVALFEGEVEMGLNGNKINWTRKTLDTNKKVVANPC